MDKFAFNIDILFVIFDALFHDNDYNSLFSCLLVNRYWCETVIPILWRNPWRHITKEYQKRSLFNSIVSFLPKESKEFLCREIGISSSLIHEEPSFNYLTYFRSLTNHELYDIIRYSVVAEESNYHLAMLNYYDRYVVEKEIYKLLINKSLPLKYMDLAFIEHQFYLFPGAKSWLSKISSLKCNADIEAYHFQELAKISRSIEKIFVYSSSKDNDGLAKLIQVQRNLKCFKIIRRENVKEHFETISDGITEHVKALIEFHAMFSGILFTPELLPKMMNLQKLKLIVKDLDDSYEEQLKFSVYPNLEFLHMGSVSIDTMSSIIEKTKGNLRKIWVDDYKVSDDINDTERLIRAVYNNCPRLEKLSIVLHNHDFMEFEKLLRSCRYLKTLYIKILSDVIDENEEDKKLLSGILEESAPALNSITFSEEF